MESPLLETKLYLPRWRRGLVPRPRLSERLNRGAEATLTLVSAPAGFGKTTLLAEWLASAPAGDRSTAWLSLDQRDNHPASFWGYLIAALQTAAPEVGVSALALLRSPLPPPIDTVLTTLLNELGALSNDLVLVLDDYHLIDSRDIQEGMAFLLDHLPPRVHLVIASRADPPLPLARLRARGELVEIRAANLLFTPDEAAAFLNESMGLGLSAADVAVLETRTEGWIAALQLAALSMRGRDDLGGFIASFTGDDRYIVDYLVEEVLQRQSERVRGFLLQTSILDRLSGPLCDAVTGQADGKAMLENLDRANLFVVPLDDRRRWYRYHHLFADILRAHLVDEQPHELPNLHRRASAWYERNGERAEAIWHALAGEDFAKAAELVELAAPALFRSRQEATALGWLGALPDELLRYRPVLSNAYAGVLLSCGVLDGVDARLRDAERWLDAAGAAGREDAISAGMVVVDQESFRRLPGSVAVHRAGRALVLGDLAGAVEHARRALELAPEDDHLGRGGAAGLLGLAAWTSGELGEAHRSWSAAVASLRRAGHISDALGCTIAVADIWIAQGRLGEAMSTYERAVQFAAEHGGPALRGTADMRVGMGELHRERGDLEAARQNLSISQELGEHAGLAQNRYRWRVAMARVRQADGDLAGALDLLDEAERVYTSDFFPNVRPIAALKARVWIAQGQLGKALDWVRDQGLSAKDDLSFLREFEHITLARVLLARSKRGPAECPIQEAMGLMERLLQAAEEGKRTASVIEILVLQALAQQTQRKIPAALTPLERALTLAEPEGYVRIFVDEGPPMAELLEAAAKHGDATNYVHRLLTYFGKPGIGTPVKQHLVEPLSERELEVLRLLGTDLDGPEIARELVVSLNTMRTHTKNIYAKLGVNTRRAAVRRAEELAL
jgi:LuxR family transcriptional regulator, maltose regulon positive regulatory protein